MGVELRLQVSEEGADPERIALLTGYLRAELLHLDVQDVSAPPAEQAPPGARAPGMAVVGSLLVALGQSAEGLRSVVSAIKDWVHRGAGRGKMVRLELDGDTLELSQASAGDQERLIELFISRHNKGTSG
jgi:hypothetical protein